MVLLGRPGCGKGTQAARISDRLGVPKLSTGDMLRDAAQKGTTLGRRTAPIMAQGALVPDELVIGIVEERLAADAETRKGFVLDGFPRTLPQAEALADCLDRLGHPLDRAILVDVPEETIVRRVGGRRSCAACGAVYHLESAPPKVAGQCDNCSRPLVQRPDDSEAVTRTRIHVYDENTAPLVGYYAGQGLLARVHGDQAIDAVALEIDRVLGLTEASA